MGFDPVDLDAVAASLDDASAPLDVDALIVTAARYSLERRAEVPGFAPGARYKVGDRAWYQGEIAEVIDVRTWGNARQGAFQVIDLHMPDGAVRRAAAGIPHAPRVVLSPAVSEEAAAEAARGLTLQIREALYGDSRIASLLHSPLGLHPESYRSVAMHAPGLPCQQVIERALASLSEAEHRLLRTQCESIKALWEQMRRPSDRRSLPSAADTWHRFIGPVLTTLGWSASAVPGGGYLLVPDPARPGYTAVSGERACAIVVPVAWGAPLELGYGGCGESSPVFQIIGMLAATGARWGILTNGLRWRLYGTAQHDPDTGSTVSETVELNLDAAFGAPDEVMSRPGQPAAFRQWWALFGVKASMSGASGTALWTELKMETSAYARRVVRHLREALLESVFPEIAGGFVAYRFHERGVREESEEDLREIARASLGLVYRLLFLLFAECRGLLPMTNPDYRGQSLTTLLRRAFASEDDARPLSRVTHATSYYDMLLALFRNLEHGASGLNLGSVCYGVFSPMDAGYSFLERHRLSDRVVARTLVALGRMDRERIDYGALTLRHLSAVGEGLLENTLWVVEASAGQAALRNTRGEVHAMGSPPLPDYVGVSALERALAQVLSFRGERYAAAMNRVVTLQRDRVTGLGWTAGQDDVLQTAEREAVEALLGIKVLDPAMGAGMFLISALDSLVDGVLGIVASYHLGHPWASWENDPVVRVLSETRRTLVTEMQQLGVVQDPELLGDAAVLTWLLCQRSLYGVDLDPTAVALSRASLAMRAFAPGAPMLSLSAHLIEGDSLKGVCLSELTTADVESAVPAGVGGEEGRHLTREAILDLWSAAGVDLEHRNASAPQNASVLREPNEAIVRASEALRSEHGLIHWDLVFPEAFRDAQEHGAEAAGFDLVIGNPPAMGPTGDRFLAAARRLTRKPYGRIAFVMLRADQETGA